MKKWVNKWLLFSLPPQWHTGDTWKFNFLSRLPKGSLESKNEPDVNCKFSGSCSLVWLLYTCDLDTMRLGRWQAGHRVGTCCLKGGQQMNKHSPFPSLFYFIFLLMHGCVYLCKTAWHMCASARGARQRVWYPLEMELQVVVSYLRYVLEKESESPGRTARTLSCWAVTLVPTFVIIDISPSSVWGTTTTCSL